MTDQTQDELTAIELLNTLAEYQAQADLLELKKRELLDAVKVPAEIEAAQVAASVKRQAIEREYNAMLHEISAAAKLVAAGFEKPELPAEYLEAMSAYNAQMDDISSQTAARIDQEAKRVYEAKAKIDQELQAATADIFAAVERRKAEITTEFEDKGAGVKANIEKITAQAKQAAALVGHTVKGHVYMAVYVKGRVSWSTDKLEGMMALIPQIKEARKEGEPSITLRKI